MKGALQTAIGLMSGTSMDGIDVALIRTDGHDRVERGPFLTRTYDAHFRETLRSFIGRSYLQSSAGEREKIHAIEHDLTRLHAQAVEDFLTRFDLDSRAIDMIGFHGHTLFHAPDKGYTHQIGDGEALARMTGIPVVNDFRTADVRAGGQGAPLVPIYHKAVISTVPKPVAVLNIGGVASMTYVSERGDMLAFDPGPGNALLDDWMMRHTGRPLDQDGNMAAKGQVDATLLRAWLNHPYFQQKPPKSLDRDNFSVADLHGKKVEDGAATLVAFTTEAVRKSLDHLPTPPRQWLVTGGGRLNRTLISVLRTTLEAPVVPVESVGWNGDALEAEAFAYLAVRHAKGLPLSFPETTGVPSPMMGGRFWSAFPKSK